MTAWIPENFGLVSNVTECIKGFTSGWLEEQWKHTCIHEHIYLDDKIKINWNL